ncbi:alpha/beta fold hydrolase [Curvibacter sp. APW13]|uniref:alpha/beta hydrolase n=1 Tax=Curvibacter sp. APW13 TaxID=3077236 RepID=UPI0028DD50CB|nr:alpha/beta fold hydrolase [Curvibacter sp. APW13]MDT8991602.1 alpha/beta fold hydrolase [Curvibacter sp. APW13]
MKNRWKLALWGLLTCLLLGLAVACWVFSSMVLLPKVNCTVQHHVYCESPAQVKLAFDEVALTTSDGVGLSAWWMPAPNAKKAIIFVHGHGGSRAEGLRFAPALHAAGYHLLAINLRRNHGQYASMGYHERKDVRAAVDWVLQQKGVEGVALMGFSMGAATSILAMAEDPRIRAGLFSSPYASTLDVLSEAAKRDFGIPYYPLIPMVGAVIDWRGNMKIADTVPEAVIGSIAPRPVMLYHCETDRTTDASHSRRLFAAAKEPKGLWVPACDKHEQIWNAFPQEAEARTAGFFNKNF